MKNVAIYLSLMICLIFVSNSEALNKKRYKIKSGIVEYKLTGNNQGTDILYFDNFGQQEARYSDTTSSFMGFKHSTKSVYYVDGENTYSYDLKTNVATKMNSGEFVDAMAKSKGAKDYRELGEKMMKDMGGKIIGKKKILGRTCEIWEVEKMGTKTCIYKKSIPLESIVNFMGMEMSTVATSIKENVRIPKDKLFLPKTASIQNMPTMNKAEQQVAAEATTQALGEIPNFADMMKQFSSAARDAHQQKATQGLSDKEIELQRRELELKQRELDLRERELGRNSYQNQKQIPKSKSALDETKDAVNTTNAIKNVFGSLKSLMR